MKFDAKLKSRMTGWYVVQLKEFPAAISQGRSIKKLKDAFDQLRQSGAKI